MDNHLNTPRVSRVKSRLGMAVVIFFAMLTQGAWAQSFFVHPGVDYNMADLQRMKGNLDVDPWKSGFSSFSNQYTATLNYVMQGPFGSVTRNNTGVNTNQPEFDSDMAAVYNLTLMWNATGDTNYAAKATTIMTAWCSTLTNWISSDGVVGLEVSLAGYTMAPAAEILRYTYPDWTSNDTFVCANFFTNMVWDPIYIGGWGTGNQGAAKIDAALAVAVFCDNTNWFSITTNIFMTDSCDSLARDSLPTGQNAEEGRDQGHPLGAIGSHLAIANLCWKATGGEVDFYNYLSNRILLEMEYYANYNMGGTVPYQGDGPCNNYWSTISANGRGGQYARGQLWAVKAGYVNRLGLSAPYSMAYLNWFPVDGSDFLADNSVVPAVPGAPPNVAERIGDGLVSLTWDPTLGASSYKIYRATASGGPYTLVGTTASPNACFTDAGLSDGASYYFAVSAVGSGGEGPMSGAVPGNPHVLSLLDTDVGSVGSAGSAAYARGTWIVRGAGGDIAGGADNGNLAYQNMVGDGDIIVRLASAAWVGSMGKIGVMMRSSTNASAAEACLVLDRGAATTPRMFYRRSDGSSATYFYSSLINNQAPPLWLRLKRAGNSFTGYTSQDGTNWNFLASAVVVMPQTIEVGMFVCSRSSSLATGNFDHVTMPLISPPSPPSVVVATGGNRQVNLSWPAVTGAVGYNVKRSAMSGGPYTVIATNLAATNYSDTNLVNGTNYYYVVSALNSAGESANSTEIIGQAGLPDPWQDEDVGLTGAAGSAAYNYGAGTFDVIGSGADIWGTNDAFHFVYQTIGGDCDVRVRVASLQYTSSAAKAGVMIRANTNADSAQVMVDVTPGVGLENLLRTTTGGTTGGTAVPGIVPPQWVRLVRAGDAFTGYYSSDGVAWTPVATNTVMVGSNVCVGLIVCSHAAGTLCKATFDHAGIFAPAVPPDLTVTAGNAQATLNWAAVSGATSYNVQQAAVSRGPYTTIANISTTNYTDTGLTNGTTYYYVVSAVNNSGESGKSSEVSVTPFKTLPLPLHRYSFNETSGTSVSDSIGGANGVLEGSAVFDGTGKVVLNGTSGTYVKLPANLLAGLSNVTFDAWFTYTVGNNNIHLFSMDNGNGTGSGGNYLRYNIYDSGNGNGGTNYFENVISYSGNLLHGGMVLPQNVTNHVTLVYDPVDGMKQIYVNGVLRGTYSGTLSALSSYPENSFALGRSPWFNSGDPYLDGTIDEFRIYGGALSGSQIAALQTLGPDQLLLPQSPEAPAGLTVTAGDAEVSLNWTASSNATSYNVKRAVISGGPYTTITNVAATACTNTGLVNGTAYYYVVSALNSAGEGTNSIQVMARPVSFAATPLSFAAGGGQLQLTWPQDHTGWALQVQTNSSGMGLGTNWTTLGGSANTNQIFMPINPLDGSVFFRLISPGL